MSELEDVPWWYNEQATLSLWSGTIWKTGGWSFEEFSVEKRYSTPHGKTEYKIGRGDINFKADGIEYTGEVKLCHANLINIDRSFRLAKKSIGEAIKAARQVHYWGQCRVGISFVRPYLHVRNSAEINRNLMNFLIKLHTLRNVSLAWVFPLYARTRSPYGQSADYLYPGLILLAKRASY